MELLIRSLPITEKESGQLKKKNIPEELLSSLKIKLEYYLKKEKILQGFILDFPPSGTKEDKNNFYRLVGAQIATFGAAIRLPSRRVLVMLPPAMDAALVAHRLCKNLNAPTMLFFEADNTLDILNLILSY
ncbi:hypothetical protein FACS1894190_01150 [Spirochaetia bacterium]|nr:hypothetical protein FACS1894190_01150 [Spirochaetia bacterium]